MPHLCTWQVTSRWKPCSIKMGLLLMLGFVSMLVPLEFTAVMQSLLQSYWNFMLFLTIIPGCVSSLFFSVYNNSQWYFCNPLANNPHDGDISQNIYSQKLSTSQPMKPQPMISWPLMHWSISITTFQTYLYHNHQNQLQPSNAVILPLDQTGWNYQSSFLTSGPNWTHQSSFFASRSNP